METGVAGTTPARNAPVSVPLPVPERAFGFGTTLSETGTETETGLARCRLPTRVRTGWRTKNLLH